MFWGSFNTGDLTQGSFNTGEVLAILKEGAQTSFQPSKWGGGDAKGLKPSIFTFCSPPRH